MATPWFRPVACPFWILGQNIADRKPVQETQLTVVVASLLPESRMGIPDCVTARLLVDHMPISWPTAWDFEAFTRCNLPMPFWS
jgi:hypothetical protein